MFSVQQRGSIRRTNVQFTDGIDQNGSTFVASAVSCAGTVNPDNGQLWFNLQARTATPVLFEFAGARPTSPQWALQISGFIDKAYTVSFDSVPIQLYQPRQ
jgi:hypothetical protein